MSTIDSAPQPAVAVIETTDALASGQANGATPVATPSQTEGFDRWIKDFQKYESMLTDIGKANADPKFNEELTAIRKWFEVLTITEKTAALYSLLQDATTEQAKFLVSILEQKIPVDAPKPAPSSAQPISASKPKLAKLARPPSLNIPDPASPTTPTPLTARESAVDEQSHSLLAQAALNAQRKATGSDAAAPGANNTPVLPLFQKDKEAAKASSTEPLPGFSGINPYTLNMLANAGLSPEAQLLAAQLVMSGLVQPTAALQSQAKPKKTVAGNAWRTPVSARYPASALRSSGLRPTSSLKSAGLKSSALVPPVTPFSAMETPKEEDFDPEMLKDIPAWLRSLRLHKYTHCFEGLSWQELVALDDATLEAKGVAALGARRRLLRTFEHVKKRMGMEVDDDDRSDIPESANATPTTAALPAPGRSKLSINSPIFTPIRGGKKDDAATDAPVDAAPVEATA